MKIVSAFCFSAILVGAVLAVSAASAQVDRTWVSGLGLDSNLCTRTSPCQTLQHAYSQTNAGGEIDVVDGGELGVIQITHAITIANDGAGAAAINVAGGLNGVNVHVGSGDAVVLRGLTLNVAASASSDIAGIVFVSGASLLVDHCVVQGFRGSSQAWLEFVSSTASTLWVKDSLFAADGSSSLGSVFVSNNLGGQMTARLERTQFLGAIGNAIRVDGTESLASIDVDLHDVTVDGSSGGSGIVAISQTSGGAIVKIVADNVTSSHNSGYGFRAVGGTASITLSRSVSESNTVGIGASSGGQIFSYGDNRFADNTSGNGAAPTPIGLQ